MSAHPTGASPEILEACDLRFGQVGIANVRVRNADPDALRASLEVRVHEAPSLFQRAPVVVDLSFLAAQPADAEVAALLDAVREAGMLPVGLAYGDGATDELSRRLGLPLIAKFRAAYERAERTERGEPANESPAPAADESTRSVATAPKPALQHLHPVRTGQQVYAQGCDLVVVGTVANGAEVLADGNIHVYGALRGRAFAGALGDATARIFCSEFRAEIVSIAGHYRVFEELPQEFAGRAVQVWLEHDTSKSDKSKPRKLQIAAL
ncbi:MAG: Septum site-determining protein MinC [Rhodanobacteraceae bacterium]|nr:MAG: Septum site-determining protein MinC [Rhodanobacteraceae bacterium]